MSGSSSTLRGASAEAVAAVESRLDELLSPVGSRKTAQVGDDLLGLAGVVRGEAGLRRMLTDPSIAAGAKQDFVRQVFTDRVDEITLDVLATAVGHRWTTTRDLPDALETLGVSTVVRSAEDAGRVADELFAVNEVLSEEPELANAVSDPQRSVADRQSLLEVVFGSRTLTSTSRLLTQALAGSHRSVPAAVAEYQRLAAAVHGESVARVRSARALTDSEHERLAAALTRHYGRPVHLNLVVEEDLIGGVRVEVGDDVIDGSVRTRLDDARRRLAG